jgi:hypothetical protein
MDVPPTAPPGTVVSSGPLSSPSSSYTLREEDGSEAGMQETLAREAWHLHPRGGDSGGLVANIGDVVEVLTNGRYKSIEHRAVVN